MVHSARGWGEHVSADNVENARDHNLEALPPDGFTIDCFLCAIRAASAGWTRAVAILEEPT